MEDICLQCHQKSIKALINKFKPSPKIAQQLIVESNQLLAVHSEKTNPEVATYIQRLAKHKLNAVSLYHHEKLMANTLLLAGYGYWKKYVQDSANPFLSAVKLAMAGNIIDYGAHTAPTDIEATIKEILTKPLNDAVVENLAVEVSRANKILYLGDNAGEIVFDKLLIETMAHSNVTYVVRGKPVLNDVTLKDARQTGINQFCRVISNGYDAPSTLLEHYSKEFLQEYNSADLIISKGQGNFEGLMDVPHPNTYFLLMAKCTLIAGMLNAKVGDLVIKKQDR